MAEPKKKNKGKPIAIKNLKTVSAQDSKRVYTFLLPVLGITFLLFLPVLKNGFTNWDDIMYVTGNPLLKDLSMDGLRAIFTTPVVSNYHPLTILTLALNYQLAELTPWTYHLTSVLLHVMNTALVFFLLMLLSGKNNWMSAFGALLFGIHPMHVESVVWISERKDLLYTFFYVLAMILYAQYIQKKHAKTLIVVTILGALSLLCKPAAIVLPMSLLLMDYFFKRTWSWSWVYEKIPLFILSGVIAYVTVSIQSERAIASVELYSFIERVCFAGYGLMFYLVRFIFPYPLSALHPFPTELTPVYFLATLVALAGLCLLIFKVKNRNYHFAFGFYVINLLLVLQLVSIGNAVVAERYTYVPYIGLFFLLGMEIYQGVTLRWPKLKLLAIGLASTWLIGLAIVTWARIPVWKNSETLWEDVLNQYPESSRAWTNKGLIYFDSKEWPKVIADLSNAIKYDPTHANALEWRARTYLELQEGEKALADAQTFHSLYPDKEDALFILARSYDATGRAQEALTTYNQLIAIAPNAPEYTNNRGTLLFNKFKQYAEAKKDFERCLEIDPAIGLYYLNLSRCHYMLNEIGLAKLNAQRANELGQTIDPAYAGAIGL